MIDLQNNTRHAERMAAGLLNQFKNKCIPFRINAKDREYYIRRANEYYTLADRLAALPVTEYAQRNILQYKRDVIKHEFVELYAKKINTINRMEL